jgi:hypothetical protein
MAGELSWFQIKLNMIEVMKNIFAFYLSCISKNGLKKNFSSIVICDLRLEM